MSVLVTGAAGFIGFHTALKLLQKGVQVIGVDNLNNYYSVSLKKSRLKVLQSYSGFSFYQYDLKDTVAILSLASEHPHIEYIINLAAQAGVRYSLENPHVYIDSNITGFLNILELSKRLQSLQHVLYASSSSVYGANDTLPFSVEDIVDHPISLYAASKKANELMAHTYSHLYQIPLTGLRFFTVYGPWGRPDMAAFIFTKSIIEDMPIKVFNEGKMRRNFSYIDDVVDGILKCMNQKPSRMTVNSRHSVCHRVFNIGNDKSENLLDFIRVIENCIGKKAIKELHPLQAGDVPETIADIEATRRVIGFEPKTNIEQGLKFFIDWYKEQYKVLTNIC